MKRLKIVAESSVPYIQGVAEELGEVTYLPSEEFAPEVDVYKRQLVGNPFGIAS